MIGIMNVFGESLGAIRLGNFKGEKSLGNGVVWEEREVRNVEVLWCFFFVIVDGRVRDIVGWWEESGNFPFFDMVDFFEGCDGGAGVFALGSGKDRG